LSHDGVAGYTEKSFNLKVLLDPFEKDFYLPSLFIKFGHDLRCKMKSISKKVIDTVCFSLVLASVDREIFEKPR